MRSLLALLPLAAVVACAEAPEGPKLTDAEIEQKMIFHGDTIDQPHHDATVSLHPLYGYYAGAPFCTGTLIFDRWVLTAGHCADGFSGGDMVIKFGEDGLGAGDIHLVTDVIVHPSYNPFTVANDIALLELFDAPTWADPVMPLPASIGLTSADEGDIVDLAGFGVQENGALFDLMHIEVAIDDVRNKEVEYDQGNGFGTGTGGACNGDSGGPAFFNRDGNIYVAGVTSYGDANCADFGVSTKVDAFESFIESNTGELVEDLGSTGGTTGVTDVITDTIVNVGDMNLVTYTTLTAGIHDVELSGPATADFDLYFATQRPNGTWRVRMSSTSASSEESLTMDVPVAGTFGVAVVSYSGTGDYTLTVTRPQ